MGKKGFLSIVFLSLFFLGSFNSTTVNAQEEVSSDLI